MGNITLIAAIGKNRELGYRNDLIWRIPEDLVFFRENTIGKYIVMGMNTFNSLPKKLSNRKYIVLTHRDILLDSSILLFICSCISYTKSFENSYLSFSLNASINSSVLSFLSFINSINNSFTIIQTHFHVL